MKKEQDLKGTLFENAKVVRAVQYSTDKKKSEENLVYSIELELNKMPMIATLRVGKDFTEMSLVDKKTGKMLEYIAEQNGKVDFVKTHGLNQDQIKKIIQAAAKKPA